MPKIKFDTTDTDVDEARSFGSGGGITPQPGVYPAKIIEVTPGYSKGDDGEANRSKPRLEIIYQIQGGEFGGSQLWDYIILPGHESFNDSAKKRMLQLLRAAGITEKAGKGDLDTDKLVNKKVRVRVRGGKAQDGMTYRGEFSAVFKDSDSDVKLTSTSAPSSAGDEELISGDDDELITDDTVSETDWDARLVELNAMAAGALKDVAKEWKANGWDITIGGTKAELADKILAVEQEAAAQAEAGDDDVILDDDDDVILTDDDDELILEDDEAKDYLTEEQLKGMDPKELIKMAKEDFDIDAKAQGLKTKNALVAAILEAQAAPADGDIEAPF